jgi:hypothetical protein
MLLPAPSIHSLKLRQDTRSLAFLIKLNQFNESDDNVKPMSPIIKLKIRVLNVGMRQPKTDLNKGFRLELLRRHEIGNIKPSECSKQSGSHLFHLTRISFRYVLSSETTCDLILISKLTCLKTHAGSYFIFYSCYVENRVSQY